MGLTTFTLEHAEKHKFTSNKQMCSIFDECDARELAGSHYQIISRGLYGEIRN